MGFSLRLPGLASVGSRECALLFGQLEDYKVPSLSGLA